MSLFFVVVCCIRLCEQDTCACLPLQQQEPDKKLTLTVLFPRTSQRRNIHYEDTLKSKGFYP